MLIELVATTLDDALAIECSGADRIMLVSSLVEGGLTPSIGLVVSVANTVGIPVNVIIRPHSAGYCYTAKDMEVIDADFYALTETNINGVVLGMLDKRGNINLNQIERLLPRARDKSIYIGRAIDEANDVVESARLVSQYEEITAIITSGGKGELPERMERILRMREAAPELEIVASGGIGVNNLADIAMLTKAGSYQAETTVRKNRSAVQGVDFKAATEFVRFARAL